MTPRPVGRPSWPSHWRTLLVLTVLLALPAPVLAQDGATFGARPGPGKGDRSSGAFNLSIGAGSSVSDAVEILNLADVAATFDVYAVDVVRSSDGGLAPAARGAEVTGPAAWVTVDRPTVEVAPRSSAIVSFTVKVPGGRPLGDNTAALLVERHQAATGDAITSVTRIGLWLKVKVTNARSEVLGETGTPWFFPWLGALLLGLVGVAGLAWLAYVTRDRRRRWLQDRRDERALLRDFRSRRRHDETTRRHP